AEVTAGIRVEHQLVGIEAVPGTRLVGAVHAVAVNRSGVHIRHITVPDLVSEFGQLDSLALAGSVEEAELDACRIGREQREIDPLAVPGGPKWMRQAFPDLALGDREHRIPLWLDKPAQRNASGKQHRSPARSKHYDVAGARARSTAELTILSCRAKCAGWTSRAVGL